MTHVASQGKESMQFGLFYEWPNPTFNRLPKTAAKTLSATFTDGNQH